MSKKLVSHTAIYGASTVIRNLAGLIMLPIYTRYLRPEDYAAIELMTMAIDFIGIIIASKVSEAVFRFYALEEDLKNKNTVISTSLGLSFLMNVIGFMIIFIFSKEIAGSFFNDENYTKLLKLFSVILITEALITIPLNYIRVKERPITFLVVNVIKLAAQIALNVYFVIYKNMGVEGVIYSSLISSTFFGVLLTVYTLKETKFEFNAVLAKSIFLFSLPMNLGGIASFFLTFGDRFFLTQYQSLATVGIYTLAYKFAFLYSALCVGSFHQMWDVQKYKIFATNDPNKQFSTIFTYYNYFLTLSALAIALFIPDLLTLMSDSAYWGAAEIVPVLLLAYLTRSWCNYLNFGLLLNKKTRYIAYSEWTAAASIGIFYYLLIPDYGAMGAAVATLLAFIIQVIQIHAFSIKQYDMQLNFYTPFKLIFLAIAFWLIAETWKMEGLFASISFKVLLVMLYIAATIYLPVLSTNDRKQAYELYVKTFKKI